MEEENKEVEPKEDTYKKLEILIKDAIETLIKDGLQESEISTICELTKINKYVKESENMNYGNYGNYNGYNNYGRDNYGRDNYGNYNDYGRRGVDSRYRGYGHLDDMYNEYGRYEDSKERYGAGEESDKAFHFMLEKYKDFTKHLFTEAQTPQQKQMLREAIQQSMM